MPYILIVATVILYHVFVSTSVGDDHWFKAQLDTYSYFSFLKTRYEQWTSRLLIEAVLVLLARVPLLWRFLDTAVMLFVIYKLYSFTDKSTLSAWLIFVLLVLFPLPVFKEAGSVATTLNYLWPLAGTLLFVTPIYHKFKKEYTKPYEIIFGYLGLVFSSSNELLCGCSLLLLTAYILYRIYKKLPFDYYTVFAFVVCIVSLVFALTCPGNEVRNQVESGLSVGYSDLNFIEKAELGYASTFYYLFLKPNPFVLAICVFMLICTVVQKKKVWQIAVASLPTLFTVLALFHPILSRVPFLSSFIDIENSYTVFSLQKPLTYIPVVIYTLVFTAFLTTLFFNIKKETIALILTVVCIGFVSRFVLGLSPTVWRSEERTCIFLYFTICIATYSAVKYSFDLRINDNR